MRLIGAREFLKTAKPGDLYYKYWCNTDEECKKVIEDFVTKGSTDYYAEIEMYGDNSGSLAFLNYDYPDLITIDEKEYKCLFYYDSNVVGDASPAKTVYLVFDSFDEWPDKIEIKQSENNEYLTKDELLKIREWFIKEEGPFRNELVSGWALKELDNDYYKDKELLDLLIIIDNNYDEEERIYQAQVEQAEHDALYEPTYDPETGAM